MTMAEAIGKWKFGRSNAATKSVDILVESPGNMVKSFGVCSIANADYLNMMHVKLDDSALAYLTESCG